MSSDVKHHHQKPIEKYKVIIFQGYTSKRSPPPQPPTNRLEQPATGFRLQAWNQFRSRATMRARRGAEEGCQTEYQLQRSS